MLGVFFPLIYFEPMHLAPAVLCLCVCFFSYFTYSLPLFLVPCIRNSLFICSFLFLLQINLIILFDQSIQRQTKSTNKLFVCLWICAFCCVQCFLFCIGNGNGNGNGNSKANGNRNVMAKHCIAWHGMDGIALKVFSCVLLWTDCLICIYALCEHVRWLFSYSAHISWFWWWYRCRWRWRWLNTQINIDVRQPTFNVGLIKWFDRQMWCLNKRKKKRTQNAEAKKKSHKESWMHSCHLMGIAWQIISSFNLPLNGEQYDGHCNVSDAPKCMQYAYCIYASIPTEKDDDRYF